MKAKNLFLFFFVVLACISHSNTDNKIIYSQNTKRDYKIIIDNVIKRYSLGKTVSLDSLQIAIPKTKEEFSIYYSYTLPEKSKSIIQAFYKVDSEISKNAANNQGDFLRLYLELSSFVTGDFAESYFQDADFIISKNRKTFCEIYSKLSATTKKELKENTAQECN